MLKGLRDGSNPKAADPRAGSGAILRPVAATARSTARVPLRAVAESDWQSLPGGLRVRGRLRPWTDIIVVQLDLRTAARGDLSGRLGLRDGNSVRLIGPRDRWLSLLDGAAHRGLVLPPAAASVEPRTRARPARKRARTPGVIARLWWRMSGLLGSAFALALIGAAVLLYPTRTLVEARVWFPDFVWLVPLVLALEIARAARLRRLRGRSTARG